LQLPLSATPFWNSIAGWILALAGQSEFGRKCSRQLNTRGRVNAAAQGIAKRTRAANAARGQGRFNSGFFIRPDS
jgi:hypothetical protein